MENSNEPEIGGENNAQAFENPASELDMSVWSVISFEKRVGQNLNYADAVVLLEKLKSQKVSGLCIVTDQAAERLSDKTSE